MANNSLLDKIDKHTINRFLLGGLLTGGSIASIINLIHHLNTQLEEKKKRQKEDDTNENTIVLTLPVKKTAEDKQKSADIIKEIPVSKTYLINPSKKQSREVDTQRFGPKLCLSKTSSDTTKGWPTLTASVLAALFGGTVGAVAVNKIYNYLVEKRLKEELEAAKQEYLDAVMNKSIKGAEFLDAFNINFSANTKSAADRTFGFLSYPISFLALASILGTGGIAYLTKKILDEKLKSFEEETSKDIPKVKRIVFRTVSVDDDSKEDQVKSSSDKLSNIEYEKAIAGALLITMDRISNNHRFIDHPIVKNASDNLNITGNDLIKMSNDFDVIMDYLNKNDDLRHSLYNVYIDYTTKNPVLNTLRKKLIKMPGVNRVADKRLYQFLDQIKTQIYGQTVKKSSINKIAVSYPYHSLMAGIGIGSNIFDKEDNTEEEVKQFIEETLHEKDLKNLLKNIKEKDKIEIKIDDPEALKFYKKNKKKIDKILRQLALRNEI